MEEKNMPTYNVGVCCGLPEIVRAVQAVHCRRSLCHQARALKALFSSPREALFSTSLTHSIDSIKASAVRQSALP